MKHFLYSLLFALVAVAFTSCDDVETYAEQRDAERSAISNFISKRKIKVISEEEFLRDTTTNVEENEFVLFEGSGIYMQIVNRGCGEILKKGETSDVLSRFTEYNINGDSIQLSNQIPDYHYIYDKYTVRNSSGTFSASFVNDNNTGTFHNLLYLRYGSASVPGGWLVPLSYIKLGRLASPDDEIAEVNLIVPHDQGHSSASQGVYACFYNITYQRGLE